MVDGLPAVSPRDLEMNLNPPLQEAEPERRLTAGPWGCSTYAYDKNNNTAIRVNKTACFLICSSRSAHVSLTRSTRVMDLLLNKPTALPHAFSMHIIHHMHTSRR